MLPVSTHMPSVSQVRRRAPLSLFKPVRVLGQLRRGAFALHSVLEIGGAHHGLSSDSHHLRRRPSAMAPQKRNRTLPVVYVYIKYHAVVNSA